WCASTSLPTTHGGFLGNERFFYCQAQSPKSIFSKLNLSAGWLKQLFLLKILSFLFVFLLFAPPDR
ncbi:MAG TPA: hypothetical protein VKB40_12755, partial [Candidatus Acidoferrales bacterium]|nr:hypothetical protein [Candidatus Acidoferrales bacterium]